MSASSPAHQILTYSLISFGYGRDPKIKTRS